MWLDSDGGIHTVALPDPTDVMSEGFRASLDVLVETNRASVEDLLERAEELLLEEDLGALGTDEAFVGQSPPQALLDGSVSTEAELEQALQGVNLRWPSRRDHSYVGLRRLMIIAASSEVLIQRGALLTVTLSVGDTDSDGIHSGCRRARSGSCPLADP